MSTPADDDEYELEVEPPAPPAAAEQVARHTARQVKQVDSQTVKADAPPPPSRWPFLTGIVSFPFYRQTLATLLGLWLTFSFAGLVAAFIHYFLTIMPDLVYVVAIPAGMVAAFAASYASVSALAVVEGTSEGFDDQIDWPEGNWKEWFWTLPATVGMAAVAIVPGALASYFLPGPLRLPAVAASLFFLYPICLLSTLETGELHRFLSPKILAALGRHAAAWLIFYFETALLLGALGGALALAARQTGNTFLLAVIAAPLLVVALLIFFRLLGRLAWWCANRA